MYRYAKYCSLCDKKIKLSDSVHVTKRFLNAQNNRKNSELAEGYKPLTVENNKIDENYFLPLVKSNERPFTLILPPPNITGTLHLGHALTVSIQDVIIKWHKMQGRDAIWVPGLDHAGIATQVVVEQQLWKTQGLTRHKLGRDNFEKLIWKWKFDKTSTIIQQLKSLNVSLNWDKEIFTMDEIRSQAVVHAFIQLFDQGLIYRADHLINWSCILQSAISDIEVDHMTVDGKTHITVPGYDKPVIFGVLHNIAYKVKDSEEELIVSTTRPETILGDVAVAVNPKDTRYSHFIGKQLMHPFRSDLIPVIGDDFVDPEFGTGAVKITPGHDPKDFEVGKRHNLKHLNIINEKGHLTELCGNFKGLNRFEAREIIINELAKKELFKGSKDHATTIPICSRSKDVVEFLIKPQWFVNCSSLAKRAVSDVKENKLKIEPSNFEKIWFQWLENIRDWCISRQLWWGHRVPAYLCSVKDDSNKEVWVAAEDEEVAKTKSSKLLNCDRAKVECKQDEDVLDTWFSSSLQPLSVFGWPKQDENFKDYLPLSLMETGHDILFFWVARMVMLGTQLTGNLPFEKILLHGIVCDAHGRKMSKSLGNVIAPEDIIKGSSLEDLKKKLQESYSNGTLTKEEFKKAIQGQQKMFPNGIPECGADALRFTLLSHNVKNQIINFDINECNTNRLFCNKIWQATKFALLWCQKVSETQNDDMFKKHVDFDDLALMDLWICSRLSYMIDSVNRALKNHDFYVATSSLKNFFYYELCDIYLESIKTDLKEQTQNSVSKGHCWTLLMCLDYGLRALAPFMPVVSQHLHQHLPRLWKIGDNMSFPKNLNLRNEALEEDIRNVMEIVVCIRRLKKIFNVTFKHKPEVSLASENTQLVQKYSQIIKDLSSLYTFNILKDTQTQQKDNWVEDSVGQTKIYLLVPEELRKSFELDPIKLQNKKEKLLKELEKMNKMIMGHSYKEKATAQEQDIHAKKITSIQEKISRIDYIKKLSK